MERLKIKIDSMAEDFSYAEHLQSALMIFTYLIIAGVVVRLANISISEQNEVVTGIFFFVALLIFLKAAGTLGMCVAHRVIDFVQTEVKRVEGQLKYARKKANVTLVNVVSGIAIFFLLGAFLTAGAWQVSDVLFASLPIDKMIG